MGGSSGQEERRRGSAAAAAADRASAGSHATCYASLTRKQSDRAHAIALRSLSSGWLHARAHPLVRSSRRRRRRRRSRRISGAMRCDAMRCSDARGGTCRRVFALLHCAVGLIFLTCWSNTGDAMLLRPLMTAAADTDADGGSYTFRCIQSDWSLGPPLTLPTHSAALRLRGACATEGGDNRGGAILI